MDTQDIAEEVFAALGTGRQIAPFSKANPDFGLEAAYRVTASVRAKREARGERPIGRKIGFTNRTIWAEYGVYAPIWGYVYDRTVHDLSSEAPVSLSGLAEPRIEPEIVFGLAALPLPGMDELALIRCIDWIAHGFEIVQSIFPDWSFKAPDTVAAYGLHGMLLIGPRHSAEARRDEWRRELARFEIDLFRDGALVDHGAAANVLDGPLFALRHLAETLAQDPLSPPLAAGEIVTTGTLTRAFPVAPGEAWATKLNGLPLESAHIRFV
ncbi:MAG TPA: hydratase [Roseiarcus sp.]|nr:hydratase [Roseiarcus sp.]